MSYATTTPTPAARLRAAASVIAIHALIGAGVVAGLTITGTIKVPETVTSAWNVKEIPPPPPPEPQTVPDPAPVAYAPPAAPEPPIRLERPSSIEMVPVTPNISRELVLTPPPREIEIPGPAITPSIAPAIEPVGASPRNGPAGWITTNDYARADLVREREGTSAYRLVIGSDGRVDACEITRSSGHASLDSNTCRLLESRARFDPATNNRGETTVGTYTGSVTWRIPD